MTVRPAPALVLLALLLVACGGGGGTSTASAPTQAPAAQASPTPAGERFTADDPVGDCLSNQNAPIACEPAALDMRRFTVERDAAGNVIATIEISGTGFSGLGQYTLLVGIDTDRNAATGSTSYAPFHGLAPDIELAYIVRTGQQPQAQVRLFPASGQPSLGDATLVEWKQLDTTRLQATLKPALLNTPAFWIVTDLQIADRYDHIPDNARVSFPEGRVLPK